jgi:LAO/AO transport system kinase
VTQAPVDGDRRAIDVPGLVAQARKGHPRAVARLISLVEDESPALREVVAALTPYLGNAHIVGITGPPGVGKSTTTAALVSILREQDRRVGVLAVDPSSPFTGGALLGDRVRMQQHATDRDVYIRSMASRGHLGGLAWSTPQALRVLADTTVVLLTPGMGDGIQAAKAGILEIADLFVVNKADRDGAHQVVRELRSMLNLGASDPAWKPPIIETVAQTGQGIDAMLEGIERHRAMLVDTGRLEDRRRARARDEVEAIALGQLRQRFEGLRGSVALDRLAGEVASGDLDPYTAADRLVASL